jgi:hypothetical protein
MTNHFNLREIGLKLRPEQRKIIERKTAQLLDLVPYSSYLSLTFIKDEYQIKTQLTISFPGQVFRCSDLSPSPLSSFFKIEKEMKEKISDWKKQRFTGFFTKPIFNYKEVV